MPPPISSVLRRSVRAGALLLLASTSACLGSVGQAPTESVSSEAFGLQASAQRARVAALNTESSLLGLIELSADRIITETEDPVVARNALHWKANAIPVAQRAAHHPDPLISYVDEWVLLLQMRDYLATGEGQDLFGPQQDIAVEALTGMEERIDQRVQEVVDSSDYRIVHTFVENWAARNPIDNPLFVRPPVSSVAAEALGDARLGGLDALGRFEELALDAQQMAQSYIAYTPKVVLWQAQLMVRDMLDTAMVSPLLSQVDRLELSMAATRLLDSLPELIRVERSATTRELGIVAEASLVTLVRLASREREVILEELARLVRAERSALTDDVAEALIQTLEEGRDEAIVVIDHTLWRIAQMAAALIILLAVVRYLLFRTASRRRVVEAGS